jgi:hypothetical protein
VYQTRWRLGRFAVGLDSQLATPNNGIGPMTL